MRGKQRRVCKISELGVVLACYDSIKEAGAKNYMHPTTIRHYCGRKNKDCPNGYSFRWEE